MFKQLVLTGMLAFGLGPCAAQTVEKPIDVPMPPWLKDVLVPPPITRLPAAAADVARIKCDVPHSAESTHATLTGIVTWLSCNFDLPAIYDHPNVEFVPRVKLAALRYKSVLGGWSREADGNTPGVQQAGQREVVAVYNDTIKTIFLTEAWSGANPTELSILVHEMVHHLQNLGKLKYECSAAREKLAYEAQALWLKLFGRDLERDFDVDMFTVVFSSTCIN